MACAIILSPTSAVSAAAGRQDPVIGCWNPNHNGLGTLHHAPSACEVSRTPTPFPLLAIARISHVKWSHWGNPTATRTGRYTVYGQGPGATFAATMKVYRLLPKTDPEVCVFTVALTLDSESPSNLMTRRIIRSSTSLRLTLRVDRCGVIRHYKEWFATDNKLGGNGHSRVSPTPTLPGQQAHAKSRPVSGEAADAGRLLPAKRSDAHSGTGTRVRRQCPLVAESPVRRQRVCRIRLPSPRCMTLESTRHPTDLLYSDGERANG